jgi:transposase
MGSDGYQHSHQHGAGAEFGSHSAQAPRRRVEVITGLDRRRRRDEDLKAEIAAQSFAPGDDVSAVQRLGGGQAQG